MARSGRLRAREAVSLGRYRGLCSFLPMAYLAVFAAVVGDAAPSAGQKGLVTVECPAALAEPTPAGVESFLP